jgi:hypothetical protein
VHRIGPDPVLQSRLGVSFRRRIACPNHSHHCCHCFPTVVHRPRVLTAPRFSTSTCAALVLAYNLCELNAEGFPFSFSSLCFPAAPMSTEHRCVDRTLRLSPEAAFAAMTSAQARCRSLISESLRSATPPTCHHWCPSARTRCRGCPIPSELLHLPLPSSAATTPFFPLTFLACAGAPEGAQSRHCASALPAPTPFTGESLAPCAIFHPPPLAAASHLMGRFSTGLEPREVVICQNRPRHQ